MPPIKLGRLQGKKIYRLYKDCLLYTSGILTPIIVRARENGTYEILGGEHRTKAAKKINLATVPAVVYPVDTTDNKAMLIHINTNILNGRDELYFLEKVHAMVEYEASLEKQQGTRTDKKEKAEKFDRYQQLADVFHIGNKDVYKRQELHSFKKQH